MSMVFWKKRRSQKRSVFSRLVRSVISVVILTAFILGLSMFVKQMAYFSPDKAATLLAPLLKRVGVSPQQAGDVAGLFIERLFKTNIPPSEGYSVSQTIETERKDIGLNDSASEEGELLTIAFLSDSHDNLPNLKRALDLAAEKKAEAIFFLGDYTDFGVESSLQKAKEVMDDSGFQYYSLPGDRDLFDSVGPENFYKVFGIPRQTVTINGVVLVMLDNSANYTVIEEDRLKIFEEDLEEADFVVLSQPLYHPLASYVKPVMGLVKGEETKEIKEQAEEILSKIRSSGVKAIIAGDQHSFSRNLDPRRDSLEHIVVSPITDEKAEQSKPGFILLNVYESGLYTIQEVLL